MKRRTFLKGMALALSGPQWLAAAAEQGSSANSYKIAPACGRVPNVAFSFGGTTGRYLENVEENWLRLAPLSNPAMLEMFRDRERLPRRDMVPWAGEFAGKYLTSAVQVYRCRRDEALRLFLKRFVAELVSLQAEDGYLGPWPKEHRLTGHAPNAGKNGGDTWDAWGHYHVMLGLLLWNEEMDDPAALRCASRIGDLLCSKFETARLVDTRSTEMNLAPIHSLCLLYRATGQGRYLRLAEKIRDEFAAKDGKGAHLAGDYLNAALSGKEFYQTPKPRWESLHPIMGLAELYWITGKEEYRQAFEEIWWSIVKLDRHNNGGFSSGEQAQGNPYHPGAIETCCTVAWTALSVEMLRMTGNPVVADELELSLLNSVLGFHSPTCRWVTYNTPMDGDRKASAHDIVFQARAGSPELNCCSVNGARGLGMISDWALMQDSRGGVMLNWYGPGAMQARVGSGMRVVFRQETDYPRTSQVRLIVEPERPIRFPLRLRIPHWSTRTTVKVNGKSVEDVRPGTYLEVTRLWRRRDTIELDFDFSPRFWVGERECVNKVSIYRGPILLTYDRRFNSMDPEQIPTLDATHLSERMMQSTGLLQPMLLVEYAAVDGRKVALCDFASAGADGSPYRSWLLVKNAAASEFSVINPRRT
ncbi:MAG TPA: beta-L-arabinofuranosidase domain-containing protein [Patescibacteria group bacterium]|nr:beta-L-arabinofuranosidase domain-containing protein [Patescibacteria group bacterium]